ncbi:hepatocyte growth factor receptor-like [Planococcus citri]|uniref:hepatocyte growth factor receptor-like n=1 Tax=Planococcus citri TaxID=170843 RepID=UPI0031FA2579
MDLYTKIQLSTSLFPMTLFFHLIFLDYYPVSIYYRNNNIREMRWECRDAEISFFAPKLGPWEGGTSISIRINNLGDKLPLSWNITIGDTPCTISPNSTGKANENLLCVLEECKSPTENCTGPIKLISEDLVLTSTTIFEIVDPKIKHIKPTQGSTRGGTDLTIYGDYMNAGDKIEVYIDDLECVVFESSSLRLKCITGPSKQPFKSTVTVKFDGHIRTSENVYEYSEDIEPNDSTLEVPRGVPSGGPNISITFDIPAEERITRDDKILFYIRDNELEKTYYSECEISIISLICPTPRMRDIDVHALNEQKPILMDYGFKIRANTTNGTFSSYLHVHKKYPKFMLYPDSVQYLIENTGNKQTITSSVQSNNGTAIILGAVLFIVTGIFVIYCIISVERGRKMQREMNALSMEIMVMSHLVKQVELEKEVDLYTSESDMLLQPDGRMLELPKPKLPKD